MSDAVLHWANGLWLVSPSKVALTGSEEAYLFIKDGALVPWEVAHPSWSIVKDGAWSAYWIDVYSAAEGRGIYEAEQARIVESSMGGAAAIEIVAMAAEGAAGAFAHLAPCFGRYTRNPGQLHLQRAVFTSQSGEYVLHYDVLVSAWLVSRREMFGTHDAMMQVIALRIELIELN